MRDIIPRAHSGITGWLRYLRLNRDAPQPAATTEHRGMLTVDRGGTGVADQLVWGQKTAADVLAWKVLGASGDDPLTIGTVTIRTGTGSPETVVTAPVGSIFLRTNGGASTTLYLKETGAGNTGWRAV